MAKANRCVRIYRTYPDRKDQLVHVQYATSLKGALQEYVRDLLTGYGFTKPKFVGNTLTIKDKMGNEVGYKATEAT